MPINYPISFSEQTAIANILSKVDEAIGSVQNSIAAAERLKKSLMQNLLTGKMKPDGTFRTPDEFYIDEKFGKVPVGWEVKRIDDVFDFYPTASYSRSMLLDEGDCKYIHYGDIHTRFDTFLDISKETLPYINKDMVKKFVFLEDGDIIISDTSEDYEGVGKLVEIVNIGDSKVISGLHTLLIRPKTDELMNGFKGYLFNEERVRLEFLKYVTGIKVYSISKNSLANVLLPIPPRDEQIQIKNKLDSFNKELCNSKDKIKSLERLKKSLMQNLLTGKIRVEHLVNN
jgi:type I restriction enzyme S subunit